MLAPGVSTPGVGEIDLEHEWIGRGKGILLSSPSCLPGHQTLEWWHCPPPLDKAPWLKFSQATKGLGPGSYTHQVPSGLSHQLPLSMSMGRTHLLATGPSVGHGPVRLHKLPGFPPICVTRLSLNCLPSLPQHLCQSRALEPLSGPGDPLGDHCPRGSLDGTSRVT